MSGKLKLAACAVVVVGLVGCAATGSDFVDYAEKAKDCGSRMGFYSTAVSSENRSGGFNSSAMRNAIDGLKQAAPNCSDLNKTISALGRASSTLSEKRSNDSMDLALLSLQLAEQNPDQFFILDYAFNYLDLANNRKDEKLWNRVMDLYLDRGIWDPKGGQYFSAVMAPYGSAEVQKRLDSTTSMLSKAAESAKGVAGVDCSTLRYCQPSPDVRSFAEANYYDAYVEALREMGEHKRASLAEQLARSTRQERAAYIATLLPESSASSPSRSTAKSSSSQSGALNALLQATTQIAQASRGAGNSGRSVNLPNSNVAKPTQSSDLRASTGPTFSTNSVSGAANQSASTAGNSSSTSGKSSSSGGKSYRNAANCTKYDNIKGSDGFQNGCAFPIWVSFVSQNGEGAAGPINPGRREVIGKAGRIQWAACEYPSSPKLEPKLGGTPWHRSPGSRYHCFGQ